MELLCEFIHKKLMIENKEKFMTNTKKLSYVKYTLSKFIKVCEKSVRKNRKDIYKYYNIYCSKLYDYKSRFKSIGYYFLFRCFKVNAEARLHKSMSLL